jgi:hypothetical protein
LPHRVAATTNANSPTNLTDVFATLLTTSVVISTTIDAARAAAQAMHAVSAPALPLTPEVQQSLSGAARLTLQRRWMGRASLPVDTP